MDVLDNLLGLSAEKLSAYQMAARACVIFFTSLIFIRIAGIRTLGKQSAFDNLATLMLGAIMGRAVVASQSFFGSILAALVIMILHRIMAWITFRSKKVGSFLKGEKITLIKDGKRNYKNLSKTSITDEDILEAIRYNCNVDSLDKVKEVTLERSGNISIIKE